MKISAWTIFVVSQHSVRIISVVWLYVNNLSLNIKAHLWYSHKNTHPCCSQYWSNTISEVSITKHIRVYVDSHLKWKKPIDNTADSSKYKNDARNGLSMPHLVVKVISHWFLWPFTFKLHFQYGRRRPSWILMVGLVKIQKRCQKWILHVKISRKSGITKLSISICLQVTFPINGHRRPFWILASHKFRRHFREGHGG